MKSLYRVDQEEEKKANDHTFETKSGRQSSLVFNNNWNSQSVEFIKEIENDDHDESNQSTPPPNKDFHSTAQKKRNVPKLYYDLTDVDKPSNQPFQQYSYEKNIFTNQSMSAQKVTRMSDPMGRDLTCMRNSLRPYNSNNMSDNMNRTPSKKVLGSSINKL